MERSCTAPSPLPDDTVEAAVAAEKNTATQLTHDLSSYLRLCAQDAAEAALVPGIVADLKERTGFDLRFVPPTPRSPVRPSGSAGTECVGRR